MYTPQTDPPPNAASRQSADGACTSAPARLGWRIHRRLYDWVLSWAERPHGSAALFGLAFAESSFFPIPPDVLLIALTLGAPRRWWRLASNCTVASVLGALLGYAIGRFLMDTVGVRIIAFYQAEEYYRQVEAWYHRYDYWVVFAAAFTPIPYKVFTIASGAFHMNVPAFLLVSAIGRGTRFFVVSGLLYAFGSPIKRFIDRYFDLLALLFVVLLVSGFLVIKYVRGP